MSDPLILTAAFAHADQHRFDRLRTQHFPSHLNHIAAHLTLFHHLPGDEHHAIENALGLIAANQRPVLAAVTGLRSLGRGVAFTLDCPPLAAMRGILARAFHGRLTAQDKQGWRPHVTIQNKVTTTEAAALLAEMQAAFSPFTVGVAGLSLWHYRGGPWALASHHAFIPATGPPA